MSKLDGMPDRTNDDVIADVDMSDLSDRQVQNHPSGDVLADVDMPDLANQQLHDGSYPDTSTSTASTICTDEPSFSSCSTSTNATTRGDSSPNRISETSPSLSYASVGKPDMNNIRTMQYRLEVPEMLKLRLRRWREHTRTLKNEAIRLVNTACSPNHPYLNVEKMNRLLGHNNADFIKRHPFLKDCPAYARRQVILEAVAARKSMVTKYFNLSEEDRRRHPLSKISPATAKKDKMRGFKVAFPNNTGRIKVHYDEDKIDNLFVVMPGATIGRVQYLSLGAKLRLRGQRQRRLLLERLCEQSSAVFKFPREWCIRHASDGHWYLNIAYEIVDKEKYEADQKYYREPNESNGVKKMEYRGALRIKSIDPGARTPFTIYSTKGQALDIGGEEDRARLRKLHLASDQLQSQINKKRPANRRPSRKMSRQKRKSRYALPPQERRKLKRQHHFILSKIKNLVRELHCRTAHYLVSTSHVIIMPRMEVNNMIKRRRSVLARSTKRELLTWSHSAFVHRLAIKCYDVLYDPRFQNRENHPTVLLVQPEAYTSKTCGRCGQINDRLGSRKVFKCPQPNCNYVADRDHNGAFNMIIKAIR